MSDSDPSLHSLLVKVMDGQTLSAEEAGRVWLEMYNLGKMIPEGAILIGLYDTLARELARGKRCGVCGKYEDQSCWTDC
jgi:hypothetical protein